MAGDRNRNDLFAGQPVELAGQMARVAGPLNPGEFDYRAYLRSQGIRLRIVVDNAAGISLDPRGSEWRWTRWLGDLRATCRARLVDQLDPRTAPLASALILGQREDIDPEVNDAFARMGTTHLLAISGLQIQVLAFSLGLVFRAIGLPRRLAHGDVATGHDRLRDTRRSCSLGGSLGHHDVDLLRGRDRRPSHPAGQHAGPGRSVHPGVEPILSF